MVNRFDFFLLFFFCCGISSIESMQGAYISPSYNQVVVPPIVTTHSTQVVVALPPPPPPPVYVMSAPQPIYIQNTIIPTPVAPLAPPSFTQAPPLPQPTPVIATPAAPVVVPSVSAASSSPALSIQSSYNHAPTPFVSNQKDVLDTITELPQTCLHFIKKHPLISLGASVIGLSYGYVLFRCWHITKYVEENKGWSAWKLTIPQAVLNESSQEEIADALMVDIKKYYQVSTGGYDLMQALLTFKSEIDTELKKLNTYKALLEYLDQSYLRTVLPDLYTTQMGLMARIQRLLYIKDILYVWMNVPNRSPMPNYAQL